MKKQLLVLKMPILYAISIAFLLYGTIARAEEAPTVSSKAYEWLSQQQNTTTGLLPSQQDNNASTYNNALSVMVFTLEGDNIKAKKILDFFNNQAIEFFGGRCSSFDFACSATDPCGENDPCGFFQFRDSLTGVPFKNTNRWIGDNAWLLMAIHHYQAATGDTSYQPMAEAIARLLMSFQQAEGYIASGWENDDQNFNKEEGHAEGNLDAYKSLMLFNKIGAAQSIKNWLDFNDLNWRKGPLDNHSWRVLSLGKEYGFSLPDAERSDDETLRYKNTISLNTLNLNGFLPISVSEYADRCKLEGNIWLEGTGQMATSFYRAGYRERGDFYVGQLESFLFEPAEVPGTLTLSFLAIADPLCHDWADPGKGHVASVAWYLFAHERFDPFAGLPVNSFQIANPIVKIEAETYLTSASSGGIRNDSNGEVSEGMAIHAGGDNTTPFDDSGKVAYKFSTLVPVTIKTIGMRYADDVGGDRCEFFLDGNYLGSIDTANTGDWEDYVLSDFPMTPIQLLPGIHLFEMKFSDGGTYGLTLDYFRFDQSEQDSFFGDVPLNHWAHDYVEKLVDSGITTGCASGMFCPEDAVTRAQMAVFLERGIQGIGFSPPTPTGIFEDVLAGYWAAGWIEQFYQDGITTGCSNSPLKYCPENAVSRAEMAILLLRAKYGRSYSPPKVAGLFSDVSSGYWAADWVEQLYADGITTGCGNDPLKFCPDASVTRAEMAAFLVRTFGLE